MTTLSEYEIKVLRAIRDNDYSGLINGAALNAAREMLRADGYTWRLAWLISDKGEQALLDHDAHENTRLLQLADDGCPHV